MNNLEYACKKLGWQGGTIHQLAKETGVDATDLLVMSQAMLGELLGVATEAKRSVVIVMEIGLVRTVYIFDTNKEAEDKAVAIANKFFNPAKLLKSWEAVEEFQREFHTDGYELIIEEEAS